MRCRNAVEAGEEDQGECGVKNGVGTFAVAPSTRTEAGARGGAASSGPVKSPVLSGRCRSCGRCGCCGSLGTAGRSRREVTAAQRPGVLLCKLRGHSQQAPSRTASYMSLKCLCACFPWPGGPRRKVVSLQWLCLSAWKENCLFNETHLTF